MIAAPAARRIAHVLRAPQPLADALASAAAELRDVLTARGVALVVRRDGRSMRGQSGNLGDSLVEIPIGEGDVDATLLVSGEANVSDDLALIVSLALEARFLAESAQTDGLTGVANRRTFDARLHEEWLRAAREKTSLVVAILDIDYFKVYNDRHGHLAGDDALRRVAHAASATLQRAGDRFARYGGEEFAAILPATALAGGIAAAERMRAAVASLAIAHPLGRSGRLTVSVGVAAIEPGQGGTPEYLFAAADRELYRAKAEGRDRVAAEGYARENTHDDALPQPFSALIGRDEDVAVVSRAIDAHRVVTVTGTGGVGKTRLALAVAHEAADRFMHVRFVDALGAANRDELLARVAAALGVTDAEDVVRALTAAASTPTLVVLDGCERVAEASREVLDALAAAPLRFLATSRVPLGTRDERVVRLQPLDAPATRALFEDRAHAAGVVANADDADVAALLRRLGGSPLAIELAVGRLTTTSANVLLSAFAGDARNGVGDRATLGSLLASAVGALTPDESTTLAAVSVFRGSFSASDAASIIPVEALDARHADALLRAMAGRSLLDAASHDGITRWRMIDPVRDATEALPRAHELRRVAYAAHLRWCLARLDAIAARSGTATNRAALIESELVIDEVRAALDRALRDDQLVAIGAELCYAAVRQWFAVRHPHEGRVRCEEFIDRSDRLEPMTRARLHASAARLAFTDGDLVGTETHARAAEALLGNQDVIERSSALNFLGIVAKFRGDVNEAERLFAQGVELNARIGNKRGEAIAIGALGAMAFDFQLDYDQATRLFRQAATMFREIGDDLNAIVQLGNLAEALSARGDVDQAVPIIETAAEECRAFANRATSGHLFCVWALVHEIRGDVPAAARAMREVLAVLADGTPGALVVMTFDFSARIAARAGQDPLAATLIAAAEHHAAAEATPFLPIQRFWRDPVVKGLRERLGVRYDDHAARGRAASEREMLATLDDFLQSLEEQHGTG
ncbi:MAG: diguanylate cyclase response regulator [Candidatus Eremiobacteraeota bacterium]|nr:diguanylate cyclase response regulator [Candidatus Eremiobacteraeota bacterium]